MTDQCGVLQIPHGGIPLDALAGGLEGTGFQGAAHACRWLWGETGNFFLDDSYEDGNYDGFVDPWEDELIEQGTGEWRRASALMDSAGRLADWLEEDLAGRPHRDAPEARGTEHLSLCYRWNGSLSRKPH